MNERLKEIFKGKVVNKAQASSIVFVAGKFSNHYLQGLPPDPNSCFIICHVSRADPDDRR